MLFCGFLKPEKSVLVNMAGLRPWIAFGLAWVTLFMTYSLRKPVGLLKINLEKDLQMGKIALGLLDASFLLPYSLTQVLAAAKFDSMAPSKLLSLALALTSAAMFASSFATNPLTFCLCLCVSGAAQAPVWPACVKIVNSRTGNGTNIGLLSTAMFVGAFGSTALTSWWLTFMYWRFCYIAIGAGGLAISVLDYFCLPLTKESDTKPSIEIEEQKQALIDTDAASLPKERSLSELWSFEGVPEATVTLLALKVQTQISSPLVT